jgi:hypothetical protein
VENVECGCLFPFQDAFLQPGLVVVAGASVDVVCLVIAWLFLALDDAHDGVGTLVVVLVLQPVPHPVVGLADDGGEIVNSLRVVAYASKRPNGCHIPSYEFWILWFADSNDCSSALKLLLIQRDQAIIQLLR